MGIRTACKNPTPTLAHRFDCHGHVHVGKNTEQCCSDTDGRKAQYSVNKPARGSVLPHTCHMSRPSYPPSLDRRNVWAVQIVMTSLRNYLPPCYLLPLRTKYLSQHPTLEHPQPINSSLMTLTNVVFMRTSTVSLVPASPTPSSGSSTQRF